MERPRSAEIARETELKEVLHMRMTLSKNGKTEIIEGFEKVVRVIESMSVDDRDKIVRALWALYYRSGIPTMKKARKLIRKTK